MNVTIRQNKDMHTEELPLFSGVPCREFWERFSQEDYDFGEGHQTTFQVYIYDLNPPVSITVRFLESTDENLEPFKPPNPPTQTLPKSTTKKPIDVTSRATQHTMSSSNLLFLGWTALLCHSFH